MSMNFLCKFAGQPNTTRQMFWKISVYPNLCIFEHVENYDASQIYTFVLFVFSKLWKGYAVVETGWDFISASREPIGLAGYFSWNCINKNENNDRKCI
jgi:hypothetical protein